MAKWIISADALFDHIMARGNGVTLNDITFDTGRRVATFDVVGSDVPDSDRVKLVQVLGRWDMVSDDPTVTIPYRRLHEKCVSEVGRVHNGKDVRMVRCSYCQSESFMEVHADNCPLNQVPGMRKDER